MLTQGHPIAHIESLMFRRRVMSLSGSSGTGKTTFALQLVGSGLTRVVPYQNQCIWIQASELFPKMRLLSMFQENPKKQNYLTQNIFVTPTSKTFSNYKEQRTGLEKLIHTILPPFLKFIVVDNISHHLRYKISKIHNVGLISKMLDDFYNNSLYPLIMLCQRENMCLILIHEVSFDPISGCTLPFFHKLYDRLDLLHITLSNTLGSNLKTLKVKCEDDSQTLAYEITAKGLIFL